MAKLYITILIMPPYWLSRYLTWYNTVRRHGGYVMEGRTPQQRIEEWILNKNTPIIYKEDVNETLILYIP